MHGLFSPTTHSYYSPHGRWGDLEGNGGWADGGTWDTDRHRETEQEREGERERKIGGKYP